MKRRVFIRKDEEGVSPVIATILMVAITVVLAAVLYIMVMNIGNPGDVAPIGKWGSPEVISSTEVHVPWAKMSKEAKPMSLEIVLIRNSTDEGMYSFTSNNDGILVLSEGEDVGTLTYSDLMNNGKVNTGDAMEMTDLTPGSEYKLVMLWKPNGDQMDSVTFSTLGL